jgi:hypothetical protein
MLSVLVQQRLVTWHLRYFSMFNRCKSCPCAAEVVEKGFPPLGIGADQGIHETWLRESNIRTAYHKQKFVVDSETSTSFTRLVLIIFCSRQPATHSALALARAQPLQNLRVNVSQYLVCSAAAALLLSQYMHMCCAATALVQSGRTAQSTHSRTYSSSTYYCTQRHESSSI